MSRFFAREAANDMGELPCASSVTRSPLCASSMAPRAIVLSPSERISMIMRATTGGSGSFSANGLVAEVCRVASLSDFDTRGSWRVSGSR